MSVAGVAPAQVCVSVQSVVSWALGTISHRWHRRYSATLQPLTGALWSDCIKAQWQKIVECQINIWQPVVQKIFHPIDPSQHRSETWLPAECQAAVSGWSERKIFCWWMSENSYVRRRTIVGGCPRPSWCQVQTIFSKQVTQEWSSERGEATATGWALSNVATNYLWLSQTRATDKSSNNFHAGKLKYFIQQGQFINNMLTAFNFQ